MSSPTSDRPPHTDRSPTSNRSAPAADGQDLADFLLTLPLPPSAWQEIPLAAGEVLFRAGEPGDAFYLVSTGELEVYAADDAGRKVTLARLGPGAYVGEMALIGGGNRTASVAAVTPSTLKALSRDDFLEQLYSRPDLSRATIGLLEQRLRNVLGYLDYLIAWARMVAEGKYEAAQAAIHSEAGMAGGDTAHFVRTFADMIAALAQREAELKRALHELRIQIDQSKHEQEVAEITDTDFFRQLESEAKRMRERQGKG